MCLQEGKIAAAKGLLQQVLSADARDANALQFLGACHLREGDVDEAINLIQGALRINSHHSGALNNLGFCYFARENFEDAAACFERALALNPNNASIHYNLANAYLSGGALERAFPHYQAAYNLKPDHVEALRHYVYCSRFLASWTDAAARDALVKIARDGGYAGPPFIFLSLTDDPAVHLNAARSFVQRTIPVTPQLRPGVRPRGTRTRIAYVSYDFNRSAVAHLIVGLLEDHDRTRFEIFGISLGPDDNSDLRRRLEQGVDHFIDVQGRSDKDIAQVIRDLGIDIAVDLNGHTKGNRMGIFAYRPAPIQTAYLGYSSTSGAEIFDYIVADSFVISPDQQKFYTEKLWPLTGCFLPIDARREPVTDLPNRQDHGLPSQGFVFCSFSHTYKLNPELLDVWARILIQVESSVLWLVGSGAEAEKNLRREAAHRGLDPQRLVFAPKVPDISAHLSRYRLADLFLDSFPYNAGTTASDALWMGLPVLTLSGTSYVSRMAGSLLHAAGLPDLVTATVGAYEALAVSLATQPSRLNGLKGRTHLARGASRLFAADRHRREMEAAFEGMMDRYHQAQMAGGLEITE